MRVLVTGGADYLGSILCESCSATDAAVRSAPDKRNYIASNEREWNQIGRETSVTGVLASAGCRLALPLASRDDELAFYRLMP
jgi:hypothetical protein